MPYCSRCGVEVNDQARKCPLCNAPIQQFYEDPSPGREYPKDQLSSAAPRLSSKEKTQIAIFLTTFGILVPLLITIAVDITVSKSITWSIHPIIDLISCWFMVMLPLIMPRKSYIIVWGEFLITCGTLSALYLFGHLPVGIMTLGIPIALFGTIITHAVVFLSCKAYKKGGNIAGFILIGIALFCGLTDLLLSYKLSHVLHMEWSLIVLAALLPVSAMLLYLHYRNQKRTGLSRFFHT